MVREAGLGSLSGSIYRSVLFDNTRIEDHPLLFDKSMFDVQSCDKEIPALRIILISALFWPISICTHDGMRAPKIFIGKTANFICFFFSIVYLKGGGKEMHMTA